MSSCTFCSRSCNRRRCRRPHRDFALVNSGGITLAATLFIRLAATAARAGVVVHAAIGDAILIILVLSVIHVGAVAAATTAARHAEGNKATAAATAAFYY